jgi:4a-hydroxytetrahydrobiopterin dehydratase
MSLLHYNEEEIRERLVFFPNWSYRENRLYRSYVFRNFREALAFLVECGIEMERLNHHAEWKHVYNRVEVWLMTHEAGGITDLDFQLAELMDTAYHKYQQPF